MKKALSLILTVLMVFSCLGLSAFASEDTLHYVVLGDSIAYGSGLSNPKEACYGKIIADTYGYTYENHAIPGHTTTRLLGRLGEDKVIEAVKKADIISVSIGGNDFLMDDLSAILYHYMVKGDTSRIEAIEKSFYNNFCSAMDIIRENNETALVLAQTIYNPQFKSLKDAYQAGGEAINRALTRYNEEHPGEIVLIDVAAVLNGDENNFAGDGIHPSAKGNLLIAKEIAKTLCNEGIETDCEIRAAEQGKDADISPIFAFNMELTGKIFSFFAAIYRFFARIF